MSATSVHIAGLGDALDALQQGELVVYPTETFYGIGADPFSPAALERLFTIKERHPDKPIALIAADPAMAFSLASSIPPLASRLARAFWPGPLTIVLPARTGISPYLIGPGGVGVRVSPAPVARALSAALGRPITATSANLSGQPPTTTLAAARAELSDKVKVFLEGGTLPGGAPSTVVECTSNQLRVIRAGVIAERELRAALGEANPGDV